MFFTREELRNKLRKEINRSLYVNSLEKRRMHKRHLLYLNTSLLGKSHYVYRLINKIENKQNYWLRYFKNRRRFLKFNRIYIRSKSKQIYNILNKYEHYILNFKSFYSNFYIMLTDSKGNPILSCSTGQVSYSRSKKRKNSMMLIYPMMQKIKSKLLKHGIKHIAIHIKTDINSKIISAIKFLNYSKLKFIVSYIALLKPIAHHFGRRKKKPRRI